MPHEVRASGHTSVRLRVVVHQSASRSRASIVSALAPRAPSIDICSVVYRYGPRVRAGAGRTGEPAWGLETAPAGAASRGIGRGWSRWWRPLGLVAERNRWLTLLRTRLGAAAHDAFPRRRTGACRRPALRRSDQPAHPPVPASSPASWATPPTTPPIRLGLLRAAHLARRSSKGWSVGRADRRDAAAARLGVVGRLADPGPALHLGA